MFDTFGLTLMLLPLAAALGWYLRSRVRPPETQPPGQAEYLQGVQFLVNDETDKAMDVFIRLLDVDNDTIETHLALGALFRRRGEVDRALRIHQNLVARPNLDHVYRNRARMELAQDYMKAGVLDRAEGLYLELIEQGMFLDESLDALISIYEKERDWERALDALRRRERVAGQPQRERLAQYACELAEEALRDNDTKTASTWLRKALADDRGSVRASLLEGRLRSAEGDHAGAIKAYRRVIQQDPRFIGEIVEPLRKSFSVMNDTEGWQAQIRALAEQVDQPVVHVAAAHAQQEQGGDGARLLADHLAKTPTWTGFLHLLELNRVELPDELARPLGSLHQSLRSTLASAPLYQCGHCGFAGRAIHWQCPSCRHWASMTPVSDVVRRH